MRPKPGEMPWVAAASGTIWAADNQGRDPARVAACVPEVGDELWREATIVSGTETVGTDAVRA